MRKMTDVWRLDSLPSDVLILIFDYCHAFDLVRLSEVCTRFYDIIRSDTLWIKKSKQPLVTNQVSKRFRERCNSLLSARKKWHVSCNWDYGRYEKKFLFSQETKLMPWIQLTRNTIWWSGGNQLYGFRRSDPFVKSNRVFSESNIRSDICKFIVRDDYVITGHRDGSVKLWKKAKREEDHLYFNIEKAHSCDVNAVDETKHAIISGAGDGTVKIWNPIIETIKTIPMAAINIRDRVWSLSADPTGLKFAVGSAGNNGPALHIFDIECCSETDIMKHMWQRGAGILDMVWDNPHTLLTGGYDTFIRKWDMRTGTCVYSWPDPTNATLYCISSDYQYTLVTGTQYNAKAVLWDQRQRKYKQLYFMNSRKVSSPIYSLSFDSSRLYAATDQYLTELTFSGHSYKEFNYKDIDKEFPRYGRSILNWTVYT